MFLGLGCCGSCCGGGWVGNDGDGCGVFGRGRAGVLVVFQILLRMSVLLVVVVVIFDGSLCSKLSVCG